MDIEERFRELEIRVKSIENRVTAIENSLSLMTSQVDQFGKYKTRTEEELKIMNEQINLMIESCELLVKDAINQEEIIRAKAMLRRLRNNKTRIIKARKAA